MQLKTFIGAIVLLMAQLLFASPSSAQVATWSSVTHWPGTSVQVTCQERVGGNYPEDGHFIYCGTDNSRRDALLAEFKTLLSSYPLVKARLLTPVSGFDQGVTVYIFKNQVEDRIYGSITQPSTAQVNTWTQEAQANPLAGDSDEALALSSVYEEYRDSTGWHLFAEGPIKFVLLHELGHQHDYWSVRPNPATSGTAAYRLSVEHDQVFMDAVAPAVSPVPPTLETADQLRNDFHHYLVRNDPGTTPWSEIYAEQFAGYIVAHTAGITGGYQRPTITNAFDPYHKCSALWAQKEIVNDRAPNVSEIQIAGCHGTIVCKEYVSAPGITGAGYPVPTAARKYNYDSWVCGGLDGPTPSLSRQQELFEGLATELAKPANDYVREKLVEQRVKYYFFRNRTEANEFFDKQRPFNSNSGYKTTAIGERCGHTFYNSSGAVIAVAIYDSCALSTGDTANPSLLRTAIRETGRAFALTFERDGAVITPESDPSAMAGFTAMYNYDITRFSPDQWSLYLDPEKTTFICTMFGQTGNSQLETDMGAHATQKGPVCSGGVVNSPWRSGSTFHTPNQIATLDDKIPTSVADFKSKIWAEEFAVIVLGSSAPSDDMPITDRVLGHLKPTGLHGETPRRAMNCTRVVVENYRTFGHKPNNSQLTTAGCPTHADYNP